MQVLRDGCQGVSVLVSVYGDRIAAAGCILLALAVGAALARILGPV